MDEMLSWIWRNRDWIFSGVGIVTLVALIRLFFRRGRVKSSEEEAKAGDEHLDQQQELGRHSQRLQVGRDIKGDVHIEVSTPVGGLSWTSPEPAYVVARRVLAFLEDRRALTRPFAPLPEGVLVGTQNPEYAIQSVIKVREVLTKEIGAISSDSPLAQNMRAIRSACRKFLDTVETVEPINPRLGNMDYYFTVCSALIELQQAAKEHIKQIPSRYDIEVEGDLHYFVAGQQFTGVLPPDDPDDELSS